MKVCGFSFIRNAVKFDYPIVEAIKSVLPLCDHFVLAVGKSEDDTLRLVSDIDPKVEIINTIWNDDLRKGGKVLALETDKAFKHISEDFDWCIYVQGDEVFHEDGMDTLAKAMKSFKSDLNVDGLLLKYRHFYGSYDYIGDATNWYRHEIRVIRNLKSIYSYRDAQGFRKGNNRKLQVKKVDAYIHHYGWVKNPEKMQAKVESFNRLWHNDEWVNNNIVSSEVFDYGKIKSLQKFKGTHPEVILKRISKMNWSFSHDISRNNYTFKDRLKLFIQRKTGYLPGEYRNYKEI